MKEGYEQVNGNYKVFLYLEVSAILSVMRRAIIFTSGKNHFHEMNGDVGMAGWK